MSEHQIELLVTTQDISRPKNSKISLWSGLSNMSPLSPHFPHGYAHAEKAVHVVKQIYLKADDIKLALLLLKTMPISNNKKFIQEAPANYILWMSVESPSPLWKENQQCYKI